MSYTATVKKKQKKVYIWLVVDRDRNKLLDFIVTESKDFNDYLPLALQLQERYKIEIVATDNNL